jgi:hypothetical protein
MNSFLLLAFIFLFGSHSAQASNPRHLGGDGEYCQSLLISQIQKMAAKRGSLSKVDRQDIGLPYANSQTKRIDISSESMRAELSSSTGFTHSAFMNNDVFLDSDLGPTVWRSPDLNEWFDLWPIVRNENLAAKELIKIASSEGYCTSGLLPALCKAARDSREARLAAMARTSAEFKNRHKGRNLNPEEAEEQFDAYERARLASIDAVHAERGLIQFPWGSDIRSWTLSDRSSLLPEQAREIFEILVREALIRHVLFHGLDGKVHSGNELPLDTRLAIASFPSIRGLMPFFLTHPLDLPEDFVVGGVFENLSLLHVNWKTSQPLKAPLLVGLGTRSSVMEITRASFSFDVDDENLTSDRFKKFKEEIEIRMNDLAREFTRQVGLKKDFSVETHFKTHDFLDVRIRGLSKLNQILFYYFVAERVPKFEE